MIVQVTKIVINYRIPFYIYLVSECSFHDLHFSYRIGISPARKTEQYASEFGLFGPEYISKPTKEQWELTASEIERRADFPHCLGAVGGKHIRVIVLYPARSR